MNNKNNGLLIFILMTIFFFLFLEKMYCAENLQSIDIGFIDNGFWCENGLIFIEANPIENKDDLFAKYKSKIKNSRYIEIDNDDIENYFSYKKGDKFEIYSIKGYIGEYKIKTFFILIDGCSNNYYTYAILDNKYVLSPTDSVMNIVAIKRKEIYKYEIYSEIKISKNDEIRINKILSKKLSENIKNTVHPPYMESFKKNNKIKSYELKYQVLKYANQNNLMINAVWHFKDDKLKSSAGYYLTNIFIISNNKIKDISIKMSFDEILNLPKIIFGINEINKNEHYWLIKLEMFEGNKIQLFKFDSIEEPSILIDGNYFGC